MKISLAFCALVLSFSATAQTFPQPGKPVRIVVPFPPGGQTDIQARAIASETRAAALADLPTMREQGFDVGVWGYLWFWGPAGMPPGIVAVVYRHLAFAIKHPDIVKLFGEGGSEASGISPAEMAREVRRLDERWGAIIREIGVKLDQ